MLPTLLVLLTAARGATWQVDSDADTEDVDPTDGLCADAGGACSLGAALDQLAHDPRPHILLPAGTFVLPTEDPTRTVPGLTEHVVIEGRGPRRTRIEPTGRWLTVDEGTVELVGLSVRNGTSADGVVGLERGAGSVEVPHLTLREVGFVGNHATVSGGALLVRGDVVLEGVDTRFQGNTSVVDGGAMVVEGWDGAVPRVSLRDTVFEANEAPRADAFTVRVAAGAPSTDWAAHVGLHDVVVRGHVGVGPAVEVQRTALRIVDSVFEGNTSDLDWAAVLRAWDSRVLLRRSAFLGSDGGTGGAVNVSISDQAPEPRRLDIEDSLFRDNVGRYAGGAVFADVDAGTITVRGSGFVSNHSDFNGGGLSLFGADTSVWVWDSWFVGNDSDRHGGGAYVSAGLQVGAIHQSLFLDNAADQSGGGLYLTGPKPVVPGATPIISHLTAVGNRARADGTRSGAGGGLYLLGDMVLSATVALDNVSDTQDDDCFVLNDTVHSTGDSVFRHARGVCGALPLAGWTGGAPTPAAGDLTGTALVPAIGVLDPLAYRGGRPYFAPSPGGILVDAAQPPFVQAWAIPVPVDLSSDLLGLPRRVDGDGDGQATLDVGAVERQRP